MKVWLCTLSDRLSRKSSYSLKNMAEKNNQSLYNDNNCPQTLRDHMNLIRISAPSCIFFSHDASHFIFKSSIIQLLPNFHGLDSENSYLHLRNLKRFLALIMT
jgi:hypothetical protein